MCYVCFSVAKIQFIRDSLVEIRQRFIGQRKLKCLSYDEDQIHCFDK